MGTTEEENEIKFCFDCGCELEKPKRRYFGKFFCNYCYQKSFAKNICHKCGLPKRIYKTEQCCQSCLMKAMPCIRCGKVKIKIGKILEGGIACNSCASYFRKFKRCDQCGEEKKNVRIYTLTDENKKLCYQCIKLNFHEKCSICGNKELIHWCNLQGQKFCKRCALGEKVCQICYEKIPGGKRANKCDSCSYVILFGKRKNKYFQGLEPNVVALFSNLLESIHVSKGIENATRVIPHLFPVILNINKHFIRFQILPSMSEIDCWLKKSKIKHYYFILEVLHDHLSQDYESFLVSQTINRQIDKIGKDIPYYIDFKEYVFEIQNKSTQLHSQRLAITSAVMLLTFTQALGSKSLTQIIVDQFCWLYWGQRASVTGFINYINKKNNLSLCIKKEKSFKFERRKESKMRLEQQILDIFICKKNIDKNILLKKVIAYMHDIELPKELEHIDLISLMGVKDKIRLKNITFTVPIVY